MKKNKPKVKELSEAGLKLIAQFEGFRGVVYADVVGLWTVGYGHLLTKDELTSGKIWLNKSESISIKTGMTKKQGSQILKKDAGIAEAAVAKNVTVELNQDQFDALCSFVFNVGVGAFKKSTLLRVLNEGGFEHMPVQLRRWVYAAGKKIKGLEVRRSKEARYFQGLSLADYKVKTSWSY